MGSPLLMEWNEKSTSQWEWENLFMFNAKAAENYKSQRTEWGVEGDQGTNSASFYASVGGRGSGGYDMESGHTYPSKSSTSASANSSSIGDGKTSKLAFEAFRSSPNNFNSKEEFSKVESNESSPTLEPSSGCGESLLSLKLGKQMYFEDPCVGRDAEISNFSMIPMSSPTSKKFKSSCKSTQPQHCQVEGCNLDLTSAKDYHRKHRVCESHSKSSKVIVGGRECRFCQQCSRFHNLSAFDEKKRSCRRRLSDHNARRRKPQTEAVRFNSPRLSSSAYANESRQISLVSDGVPLVYSTAAANLTWVDMCDRKCTQTKEHPLKPAKARDTSMQLCFSSNEMPSIVKTLNHDSGMLLPSKANTAEVLNPGLEEPMISMEMEAAQDFRYALSLLSTDSRTSQEAKPALHPHDNHNSHSSMPQSLMNVVTQGSSLASSMQWRNIQQYADSRPHFLNSSNKGSSHFQDFQLFKAPHEPGFYSNRLH